MNYYSLLYFAMSQASELHCNVQLRDRKKTGKKISNVSKQIAWRLVLQHEESRTARVNLGQFCWGTHVFQSEPVDDNGNAVADQPLVVTSSSESSQQLLVKEQDGQVVEQVSGSR